MRVAHADEFRDRRAAEQGRQAQLVPAGKEYSRRLFKALQPARLSSAPEVPTLKESGVPLVAFAFLGVCAGSGTPQPVIAELNSRIRPIVEAADYRALIEKSGSVPVASSPQEMQAVIDAAVRDAAPIIAEFGLQVD